MPQTDIPRPDKETRPSPAQEARRIIEEYADDLRAIINQLRRRLLN